MKGFKWGCVDLDTTDRDNIFCKYLANKYQVTLTTLPRKFALLDWNKLAGFCYNKPIVWVVKYVERSPLKEETRLDRP